MTIALSLSGELGFRSMRVVAMSILNGEIRNLILCLVEERSLLVLAFEIRLLLVEI